MHVKNNPTRWSPIQLLKHQLLLNFKYWLAKIQHDMETWLRFRFILSNSSLRLCLKDYEFTLFCPCHNNNNKKNPPPKFTDLWNLAHRQAQCQKSSNFSVPSTTLIMKFFKLEIFSKEFGHTIFLDPRVFWTQHSIGAKQFWTQKFFRPNKFLFVSHFF